MSVERLPDFALDDGRPLGQEFAALGIGSSAKPRATCAPYPTAGTPTAPTGDWS